jgi:putative ABC transport system permease protein
MLKNLLKIAFRNLFKHKAYTAINILGLSIGITCCFLIVLYVINELSFERFHEHRDQIYRATMEMNYGGQTMNIAAAMAPLGPALSEEFQEVIYSVRVYPEQNVLVSHGDTRFREEKFFFADSTLFDVFTFPLLVGNPKIALRDPYSVVITEEAASKYFGDEDPIGKVLTYENHYDFVVTGILQKIPPQTQIKADFFATFSSLYDIEGPSLDNWGRGGSAYTYFLLSPNADPTQLQERLPAMVQKYAGDFLASIFTIHIQPLKDIYLYSNLQAELDPNGDITYVYLFSAIAVLILLVACINFMNLTTARSIHRAREVGMRKTLGAQRSQLIRQFLGESFALTLISVLLAFAFLEISLPYFSRFLERDLTLSGPVSIWILPALIVTLLIVGLVSGSYPALYLSRYLPATILKSGATPKSSKSVLRRILVVFQFAVSIALMVATAVALSQMTYTKKKDLGFDKDHVVMLTANDPVVRQQYEPLRQELLKHPNVLSVSGALTAPASGQFIKRGVEAEGIPVEDIPVMFAIWADFDYIQTMGMQIVAGRDFSRQYPTDATEAYILNQTAIGALGWTDEEALGKQFSLRGSSPEQQNQGRVIGVIKDFHLLSFHELIEPLFIKVDPRALSVVAVRIASNDISGTLKYLESTWNKFVPSNPFEYTFVDDNFAQFYRADQKFGQIFVIFSILAIVIACLGLFGLSAFAVEQRTKEIGIRKVLGASIANIIGHLSREFIILIVIANVIACPVAYYGMNKWLQNFAYHIDIRWVVFALAAMIALMVAVATMSVQTIRAALSNPVNSLRYE